LIFLTKKTKYYVDSKVFFALLIYKLEVYYIKLLSEIESS